jgi:hypothetical protein
MVMIKEGRRRGFEPQNWKLEEDEHSGKCFRFKNETHNIWNVALVAD